MISMFRDNEGKKQAVSDEPLWLVPQNSQLYLRELVLHQFV